MTREEAKRILELYRPHSGDAEDAETTKALALASEDQVLSVWLREHSHYQTAVQKKFREIPVPPHLKEKILAERKVIRPQIRWASPRLLRIAAAVVFLLGLGVMMQLWIKPRIPDHFADYQTRMVRSALREYKMELVTSDLKQVRQLMASRGAPSDFAVPKNLGRLQLTGGGVLHWRNHPVSMVCFNRGDNKMLFLFVMDRSSVKDPPPQAPELSSFNKLQAVSWTEGDKTYFLAGPRENDFLRKYL